MTAKETCEREGAYLAIINSLEEANLVKKLFNRDRDVGTWLHLGFHDLYKEGKYVTLFGEPLSETGYITWSPGQPDNYNNNENCGSMHPEGGLNDLNCSVKKPFVTTYSDVFIFQLNLIFIICDTIITKNKNKKDKLVNSIRHISPRNASQLDEEMKIKK
ncbi:Hemolymph lipopolysaccharide-binding protein [Gryllus bimaculatus]|nr:Hemolymph lipopolysaccharide-binding protein [Gryllus bimaculatus]